MIRFAPQADFVDMVAFVHRGDEWVLMHPIAWPQCQALTWAWCEFSDRVPLHVRRALEVALDATVTGCCAADVRTA